MVVLREGKRVSHVEGESIMEKTLLRVHEAAGDRLADRRRMDLWSF